MKIYLTDRNALAYFEEKATPEFWDEHWKINVLRKYVLSCTSDGIFIPCVKKYLPRGSRVLEGGCAQGQLVNALRCQGYKPIGVDFAQQTVAKVNEGVPELDVRVADVRNLPFEDNEFDGYISVGVIEHFWGGYYSILSEMRRTIKKGGFLFVSFPYLSPVRKLKIRVRSYSHRSSVEVLRDKDSFYQFALDWQSVSRDFEEFGFSVKQMRPFNGIKGFKDELTWFKPFLQPIYDGKVLQTLRPFMDRLFRLVASHCALLVMQKM